MDSKDEAKSLSRLSGYQTFEETEDSIAKALESRDKRIKSLEHSLNHEMEVKGDLKADNERLMMIQKAIHKSADASKNEWVPKSEIESLRSKLAEYHNAYEGKKHEIIFLQEKLEKVKDALIAISNNEGEGKCWCNPNVRSFTSMHVEDCLKAKQALKELEGE